jgi:hypothetical protein
MSFHQTPRAMLRLVSKDVIPGQKHDDVIKIIKAKKDRYE